MLVGRFESGEAGGWLRFVDSSATVRCTLAAPVVRTRPAAAALGSTCRLQTALSFQVGRGRVALTSWVYLPASGSREASLEVGNAHPLPEEECGEKERPPAGMGSLVPWEIKEGGLVAGGCGKVKGKSDFSLCGRITAKSPLWKMGSANNGPCFFLLEVASPVAERGLCCGGVKDKREEPCLRIVFQEELAVRWHSLLVVEAVYVIAKLNRSILFKGTPVEAHPARWNRDLSDI